MGYSYGMPSSVSQYHAQPKEEDLFLLCVSTVCVSRMARPMEVGYSQMHPRPRKPNLEPQEGGGHLPLCQFCVSLVDTMPRLFLLGSMALLILGMLKDRQAHA